MIVARNAALTIREAIHSALEEPVEEVLVVDDASEDDTRVVAQDFADSRLRVLVLPKHLTLGFARGAGLAAFRSDFCFPLDADDAFLPGRVARLSAVLVEENSDFVADEVRLVEGGTGRFMRDMQIPPFLDRPPGLARLFERNYLPGVGQIAFRSRYMRVIGGYDPTFLAAEDFDLALRAVAGGGRYSLVRHPGYLMSHFGGSVSRDRERQDREVAKALRKHSSADVMRVLRRLGTDERLAQWILLSNSLFRRDWSEAKRRLDELQATTENGCSIAEADGPFPVTEAWRLRFHMGTLELVMPGGSNALARRLLEQTLEVDTLPEALNNLAVACSRLGDEVSAKRYWRKALEANPGFADARDNLVAASGESLRVTLHPLRRLPSRSEY